jgi:hypothetical protein
MHEIEKTDVTLSAAGPVPVAELRNSGLIEATYRLVLRRPPTHSSGARGETIASGDLGDDQPDNCPVNFVDKSLASGSDLDGLTLSAMVSYASPSDNPVQNVNLTIAVTQDNREVANGRVEHSEQFTSLGVVVVRFRLKAV